jgi:hypothetical protein
MYISNNPSHLNILKLNTLVILSEENKLKSMSHKFQYQVLNISFPVKSLFFFKSSDNKVSREQEFDYRDSNNFCLQHQDRTCS